MRSLTLVVLVCGMWMVRGGLMATGADAAEFTWSATGALEGEQEGNQVFQAGEGSPAVTCQTARTEGELTSTAYQTQEITVNYAMCSIPELFGASVDPFSATYELHVNGEVDILAPIVLRATSLGCSTTIGAQTVSSISYANVNSETEITVSSNISGIVSSSTGLCPSGSSGTYSGNSIIHRVGGGWIRFDP